MPKVLKIKEDDITTTLQKSGKEWDVGYMGKDGVNHYLISAKTKDDLIHKLAKKVLIYEQRM